VSFIFNNTCYGKSRDLNLPHNLRIVAKNNVFAGRSAIAGRQRSPQSECDYNLLSTGQPDDEAHGILGTPDFVDAGVGLFALRRTSNGVGHGIVVDNITPGADGRPDMGAIPFGSDLVLPVRPIPVTLDRYQLTFSTSDVKSARTKTVSATVRGKAFSSRYRIVKNDAFDWFNVMPRTGILTSGDTITFAVTLRPENMAARPLYRGAFLIRLESGYSRPLMVYAKTDVVPVTKPTRKDAWVTYIEAEAPDSGKAYDTVANPEASQGKCLLLRGPARKDPVEYRFSIPKTGKYFFLLRVKSDGPTGTHDSVYFGVDNGPFGRAQLRSAASWTWSMAAHNSQMSLICLQAFDLAAGDHVLRLAPRKSMYVDLVAVTDNPGLFDEPVECDGMNS
jgi:hypothetical protein